MGLLSLGSFPFILVVTLIFAWTIVSLNAVDVQPHQKSRGRINAFFQGKCERTRLNPCQQVCTNFRNDGFYCQCHDGFTINKDGMTCREVPHINNDIINNNEVLPPSQDATISKLPEIHEGTDEDMKAPSRTDRKADSGTSALHNDNDIHIESIDVKEGVSDPESAQLVQFPWLLKEGGSKDEDEEEEEDNNIDVLDLQEGGEVSIDDNLYSSNRIEVPLDGDTVVPKKEASCDNVICMNNGTCLVHETMTVCQCPLGSFGTYCERTLDVKYPKFEGSGYLALPVLRNAHKEFTVSIEFRPDSGYGLLLFSGELSTAKSDFFSVVLDGGVVVYRFDCGTGSAELRTANRVTLGAWNKVVITRMDNRGSVQLNSEVPIEGTAKGDYTRITFRLNLYVGGFPDIDVVSSWIGTDQNYIGCVQHLIINGHQYDFRQKGLVGEAEHGINVGDCSEGVCDGVDCQNGGTCTAKSADQHVCLCPLGFHGLQCEQDSIVHVPHFSGHSYIQLPGLQRSVLSFTEIELVFKPTSLDGAILYNGFSRDRKGDFISLAMRDGHIEFRFDLGTGPAVIRSFSPLTLNKWHLVRASRTGLMGTLDVDGQLQMTGRSNGAYTQLTLLDGLYLGGHPDYDHTSKHANLTRSFSGCLQKVVINGKKVDLSNAESGVNVAPCSHPCAGQPCRNGGECKPVRDTYTCYCPIGFTNTNCEDAQDVLPTKPMFGGESYLMYTDKQVVNRVRGDKMDLVLHLKPSGHDGLIMWSGEDLGAKSSGDYFALSLYRYSLQVRYNLGSGEALIALNYTQLFDGDWHKVKVQRDKQITYIEVDEQVLAEGSSPGGYTSLNTDKIVYLGGMPDLAVRTGGRFTQGFEGCIKSMKLATDYDVKLMAQVDTGRNIMQCRKKFFS